MSHFNNYKKKHRVLNTHLSHIKCQACLHLQVNSIFTFNLKICKYICALLFAIYQVLIVQHKLSMVG